MAQLVIQNIPDDKVNDLLDAFAWKYGWVNQATSGTKAAFARAQIRNWLQELYVEYKGVMAAATAAQSAQATARTDMETVTVT